MLAIQHVDLFGLGQEGCPDSVPWGPGTVANPKGRALWECKDSVCLSMYAGNKYRDSLAALTKAGLPHTDHPNVLGIVKGAQRAINAYITKKGWNKPGDTKTVVVDGHIGPATFEALRVVLENMVMDSKPFEGRIPRSVSDAVLQLWCNSSLVYNIA